MPSDDHLPDFIRGFSRDPFHVVRGRLRPFHALPVTPERTYGYTALQDVLYSEYEVQCYVRRHGQSEPDGLAYVTDCATDAMDYAECWANTGLHRPEAGGGNWRQDQEARIARWLGSPK